MELKKFNLDRRKIDESYSEIYEIAKTLNNGYICENVMNFKENLKHDTFNMVIVGEFSRGKSTFINALLGKKVLPSSTKPTTTIINKINYGNVEEYILHFRDSEETKKISEEDFKALVAKVEPDVDDIHGLEEYNKNLEFLGTISHADIKYPIAMCEEGIEIVDTPGTNDLDQAREEITFKFIPQSDIAIMLLSSNQILSDSEVAFLKERILGNDIKKVFFVINFKDRLYTEEDREKVMAYAKEHLEKLVENPKIYMVSSKDALSFKRRQAGEVFKGKVIDDFSETGFVELEKELSDYLTNERGVAKITKHANRGMKVIDQIVKEDIDFKLAALGMDSKVLAEKIKVLSPELNNTKAQVEMILSSLKTRILELEEDMVSMYRSGLEAIAMKANLTVNNFLGDIDEQVIARCIEMSVAPMQIDLQRELDAYKNNNIQIEINNALNKIRKIWMDIQVDCSNALVQTNSELNITSVEIDEIDRSGNGDLDLLGGFVTGGMVVAAFSVPLIVIPAMAFGGKMFSQFIGSKKRANMLLEVKKQVERRFGDIIPNQITKFRHEYKETTNVLISNFEVSINSRIDSLEKQLKDISSEKNKCDRRDDEIKINMLHTKEKLYKIKKQLEEVM